VTADVSQKDSIRDLVKYIGEREKCLCILINNAGIQLNTQQTEAKSADEMSRNLFEASEETPQVWRDTMQTNVSQIYFMTAAFLPLLQKASDHQKGYSGTIINITSISGMVKTAQHHFAYNASKAAAIHLTQMFSSEIASNGLKIRVNSLAPGVFPSEMTAGDSDDKQKSSIPKEKYESKVPARRPGKDEDMANAVLFLATNQYVNGASIPVDGGYVIAAGGTP
jgi:NAD(P)-dependent dehydrogenase (short-subunit alcohol dehydrogenase family)